MSKDWADEVGGSYHSYSSGKSDLSKFSRNNNCIHGNTDSMHQTGKRNYDSSIPSNQSGGRPSSTSSFHYLQHHESTPSPGANTMKTSSISSSSSGSRRRQKERERASRGRYKERDSGGDNDRGGGTQGERISTINEGGGGGFIRELDRSDSSRGRGSHDGSLEWNERNSMDGIPPLPSFPQHAGGQGQMPNQYHYVQPQQPQHQQRAVLHACDEKTGRCLFHPQITLRKKAILGVMGGWKDVLRACPECEAEDLMRLNTTTSVDGNSIPPPPPTQPMSNSPMTPPPLTPALSGDYRRDSGEYNLRDFNNRRDPIENSRDYRRDSGEHSRPTGNRTMNKPRSRTLSPIDSRKRSGKGGSVRRLGDHRYPHGRRSSHESESSSSDSSGESEDDDDDSEASSSSSSSSSDYRQIPERRPLRTTTRNRSGSFKKSGNGNPTGSFSTRNSKDRASKGGIKNSIAKVARTWNTIDSAANVPDSFISSYISGGVASHEYPAKKSRSFHTQNPSRPSNSSNTCHHPLPLSSQAKSPPHSGGSADFNAKNLKKGVTKIIRKGKKSINHVATNIRSRRTSVEIEGFDSSVGDTDLGISDGVEYFYDVDQDDDESSYDAMVGKTQRMETEEEMRHHKHRHHHERNREQPRKEPTGPLKSGPLGSSIFADDLPNSKSFDGIRVFSDEEETTNDDSLRRSTSDPDNNALNRPKMEKRKSFDITSSGVRTHGYNEFPSSIRRNSDVNVDEDDLTQQKQLNEERQREKEIIRQEILRDKEKQRIKEGLIRQSQEEETKQQMLRFMERQRQKEEEERKQQESLEEEDRKYQQELEEERLRQKKKWEEENLRYFEQRIKEELAEKERREKVYNESLDQSKSAADASPSSPRGSVKSFHTSSTTKSEDVKQSLHVEGRSIGESDDVVRLPQDSQVSQNEETKNYNDNTASRSTEERSSDLLSNNHGNSSYSMRSSGSAKSAEKDESKTASLTKGEDTIRLQGDQSMKIKLSTLEPSRPDMGLLNIDLTALQPSKHKSDSRSSKFGGIDVSSLQPSRASKNENEKSHSSNPQPSENNDDDDDGSIKIDRAALQPRKKEKVKTFEVSNLPWSGRFGDSGYYSGSVNEQYEPYGRGTMLYDNGVIRKGHWRDGDFVRESEGDSDSEDDDNDGGGDDGDPSNDLTSSMADLSFGQPSKYAPRDRSRSRSRSKDRSAPPKPVPIPVPEPEPEPELKQPIYSIGDVGKKEDMVTDKKEALEIISGLKVGDGAFIRRSDGKWTYAILKKLEDSEGGPAIRFTVNAKKSSKSYNKKYWESHIRPMKIQATPAQEPSSDSSVSSAAGREGRSKQRDPAGTLSRQDSSRSITSTSSDEGGRGASCPPVQSKTKFEWPKRNFRSRSRSRRRAVSCSPMRQMFAITESDAEDEDEEPDPVTQHNMLGSNMGTYALRGIDP